MAGSVPGRFNGRFSAGQVQWHVQCRAGSMVGSVRDRFNSRFSAGQVQWQFQCRAGSMACSVPGRFNDRFSAEQVQRQVQCRAGSMVGSVAMTKRVCFEVKKAPTLTTILGVDSVYRSCLSQQRCVCIMYVAGAKHKMRNAEKHKLLTCSDIFQLH